MEESSTYQIVLRRGRIDGVQRVLLRLGTLVFGQPADAEMRSRIESITDLERLRSLTERFVFVSTWAELLAGV